MLKYFRPSLSYYLSLRPLFCLFLSGGLRQVLLYVLILNQWDSISVTGPSVSLQNQSRNLDLSLKVNLDFSFLKLGDNCIQNFDSCRYNGGIYGWKFSFTVTCERSSKTWFPNVYQTIYFPQMKILNMVIPILMHFYSSAQIEALQAA